MLYSTTKHDPGCNAHSLSGTSPNYHGLSGPGFSVWGMGSRKHGPRTTREWPFGLTDPEREFFIVNLLVRNHIIIVLIRWTGLAPWEFEFPSPGSFISTFLAYVVNRYLPTIAFHGQRIDQGKIVSRSRSFHAFPMARQA